MRGTSKSNTAEMVGGLHTTEHCVFEGLLNNNSLLLLANLGRWLNGNLPTLSDLQETLSFPPRRPWTFLEGLKRSCFLSCLFLTKGIHFFSYQTLLQFSAVTPGILQWDSMLRPFTWGCTRVIGKAICPSRLPSPPNFRYHLQGQGISCASDKLACVTGYPIPFPSLLLAGTISETRKISHLLDYKFII